MTTTDLAYGLAQEAALAEMAKNAERAAQFAAEYAADFNSYAFTCQKHGDFLAVFVSRGGEKFATAINLKLVSEIRLDAGSPPDYGGSLSYVVRAEKTGFSHYVSDTSKLPPKDYHYVVEARAPELPRRNIVVTETRNEDDDDLYENEGHHYGGPEIGGVARPARDDMINFRGFGYLMTPAGLGQKTLDTILEMLSDGEAATGNPSPPESS